jgi:hypothetical protein
MLKVAAAHSFWLLSDQMIGLSYFVTALKYMKNERSKQVSFDSLLNFIAVTSHTCGIKYGVG